MSDIERKQTAVLDELARNTEALPGSWVSIPKADALKLIAVIRAALPLRGIAESEGYDYRVVEFDAAFREIEVPQ